MMAEVVCLLSSEDETVPIPEPLRRRNSSSSNLSLQVDGQARHYESYSGSRFNVEHENQDASNIKKTGMAKRRRLGSLDHACEHEGNDQVHAILNPPRLRAEQTAPELPVDRYTTKTTNIMNDASKQHTITSTNKTNSASVPFSSSAPELEIIELGSENKKRMPSKERQPNNYDSFSDGLSDDIVQSRPATENNVQLSDRTKALLESLGPALLPKVQKGQGKGKCIKAQRDTHHHHPKRKDSLSDMSDLSDGSKTASSTVWRDSLSVKPIRAETDPGHMKRGSTDMDLNCPVRKEGSAQRQRERKISRQAKEEERTQAKAAKAQKAERVTKVRAEKAERIAKEKEQRAVEREIKLKERRHAAELAEVNRCKLTKRDSTTEMIVVLPKSIADTLIDRQAREFLKNLQVDVEVDKSIADERVANPPASTESCTVPNLVRWRRKIRAKYNSTLEHWEPLAAEIIEDERHVLCLMPAIDLAHLVTKTSAGVAGSGVLSVDSRKGDGPDLSNLDEHVAHFKRSCPRCKPIYLVQGMVSLIRKSKTSENRAYQARIAELDDANVDVNADVNKNDTVPNQDGMAHPHESVAVDPSNTNKNGNETVAGKTQTTSKKKTTANHRGNGSGKKRPDDVHIPIDEEVLEDALLHLQVTHGALIHHVGSALESAEWIANYTQHISTIPYKLQRMNLNSSICMESGQVKTGDGKIDTFSKMLQEVVRVTPSMAQGIVGHYPSAVDLVCAFREHGPLLLEDIQKGTTKYGAASERRIGPSISRRLHRVFTDLDPYTMEI